MLQLQLERTGIPELRRFLELAQLIQLHREVSARLLSRQPGQAESAARLCLWVNQQLARRPRLTQDAGVEAAWGRLAHEVAIRAIGVEQSDERHAELIARCLAAAEALAQEAGMAQDGAASAVCCGIEDLRESLRGPKLAIEAQLRTCYRSLDWLDGVLGQRLKLLRSARRAA
jgi:hypothetical protein